MPLQLGCPKTTVSKLADKVNGARSTEPVNGAMLLGADIGSKAIGSKALGAGHQEQNSDATQQRQNEQGENEGRQSNGEVNEASRESSIFFFYRLATRGKFRFLRSYWYEYTVRLSLYP